MKGKVAKGETGAKISGENSFPLRVEKRVFHPFLKTRSCDEYLGHPNGRAIFCCQEKYDARAHLDFSHVDPVEKKWFNGLTCVAFYDAKGQDRKENKYIWLNK